jgi:hypothetical protein
LFTTGSECFTYYDCDPLAFTPITASGGSEGTFTSGSFIYKYHIFESSGSTNEETQRSFQQFTITDGFSDDMQMLIIGPGGPGNRGTGSYGSQGYAAYGGGGGAGQVKIQSLDGLCDAYGTINIAPGFAMPWGSPLLEPDQWQDKYGQTIVSSSEGILYNTAGIGGRGSGFGANATEDGNYAGNTNWTDRSGSVGGGSSFYNPGTYASGSWSTLSNYGGDGWSGSLLLTTGSAGGGGGAGQDGFDGTQGATARGGEGGDGLQLNFDGTLRYYAGGGAGYGPGGPSDGGRGGGGDSGFQLSTGSFYGAGGGAWVGERLNTYTTPWGDTYALNGKGSDGVVIIKYKWDYNHTPVEFISERGLSQYYDMYSLDSYNGTGSLVYNLWKNNTTASLENPLGFRFDTDNLDSGSLLIETSSLRPYVEADVEPTSSQISAMVVWEVNDPIYNQTSSLLPILTDEQFGTSSLGIYAGNDEVYGEAVVIRIGDTEITTVSGSAAEFIPRGGFHISQFSYNQTTNELLWYVDGNSGSATVNETIDDKTFLLNFNSSSAITNPDDNPVYPSPSTATQYRIVKDSGYHTFEFEFVQPQTNTIVSRSVTDSDDISWIFASTQVPQITNGTGSIESGSSVNYYPSESIYNGRTARYEWERWYDTTYAQNYAIDMFYSTTTCEWVAIDDSLSSPDSKVNNNTAQNSYIHYTWDVTGGGTTKSLDTDVTQSFTGFNDCIERPPVGLGNNSVYNITAIYTASLTWDEMRHNDDFLYPRY